MRCETGRGDGRLNGQGEQRTGLAPCDRLEVGEVDPRRSDVVVVGDLPADDRRRGAGEGTDHAQRVLRRDRRRGRGLESATQQEVAHVDGHVVAEEGPDGRAAATVLVAVEELAGDRERVRDGSRQAQGRRRVEGEASAVLLAGALEVVSESGTQHALFADGPVEDPLEAPVEGRRLVDRGRGDVRQRQHRGVGSGRSGTRKCGGHGDLLDGFSAGQWLSMGGRYEPGYGCQGKIKT